jgi:hypothetical protein
MNWVFLLHWQSLQPISSDRSFVQPVRMSLVLHHHGRPPGRRWGIALPWSLFCFSFFLCDALLVSVPFVLPCEEFRMYFVIYPLLISVLGICLLENESFVWEFQMSPSWILNTTSLSVMVQTKKPGWVEPIHLITQLPQLPFFFWQNGKMSFCDPVKTVGMWGNVQKNFPS